MNNLFLTMQDARMWDIIDEGSDDDDDDDAVQLSSQEVLHG